MQHQYTDTQIPLNKLVLHPRNVRASTPDSYSEDQIQPLAANIQAHGLLQPLIIQQLEDGTYGVVAGRRRRAALIMLAADKSAKGFTKAMKVACREVPAEDAAITSISYSENALQLPMDMLDRYEAFTAMRDQDGQGVDAIARAFAIPERKVLEALRLGNIHPEIRAAYREGNLGLEALKRFEAHPDPEVQLETFVGLVQEYGRIDAWRVRSAFQNRFVRIGDKLGAFVVDEYREAGGEVITDLIEEDSILSDSTLINKLLDQKLGDLAEQKREALGFAWSEARTEVEWDTFSDYGRVYPEPIELDDKAQAKADKLVEQMDAIAEESEAADSYEEECRLDEQHDALTSEYEQLTTGYSEGDRAVAGVIAVWERNELDYRVGMVRPEDVPEKISTGTSSNTSAGGTDEETAQAGPKISAKLSDDMAHVRTRAMGLALAQSPELARDYAEFTLIRKVLGGAGFYIANASTLSASRASYGPEDPEGSLLQIEEVFATLFDGLETDWLELSGVECFTTFRALSADARAALLAYAVAQTLEPKTAPGLRDEVREAVEREALPNIRDVWTPDEAFLKRLTKPDLITILRDVGLKSEASVYSDGKKSKLVDYMGKLFAEPFATLTPSQLEAVTTWAPDLMAHAPIEEEEPEDDADEVAIAAE
ncbi:ParB/RepB/Spo0J family partition protein [uncultured Ruegeria sp.]|uniref:ParB/RepB/Spo0J family partition protein n=1 Tax=uncultured Ruegeria sp. TaxID=259304 RepID=UPI002617B9B6|nr:ParB/RepB/Spo0J family partition protein [uncultured Ruegeria sp.]